MASKIATVAPKLVDPIVVGEKEDRKFGDCLVQPLFIFLEIPRARGRCKMIMPNKMRPTIHDGHRSARGAELC